MTIHRMDLPDAPVRVKRSVLNEQVWLWACWEQSTTSTGHRGHGYPSWADAWAAMEKHRRCAHATVVTFPAPARLNCGCA